MTLNQLINEAENISRKLTTGDIPIIYNGVLQDVVLGIKKTKQGYYCLINFRDVVKRKSPITEFIEEHPMTEEGLNKARYRLAYEDGYRSCIKNAAEWLFSHLPFTIDYYDDGLHVNANANKFIEKFREEMEGKL